MAKRVFVVIRCQRGEARTSQALRTAVSYAALGLKVTVALCGAAAAEKDAQILRHLGTLRVLGHAILEAPRDEELCTLAEAHDAFIVW